MYHVNPETGEFGICHASCPENCPFGIANHSENYEEIQIKADMYNKNIKKNKHLYRQKELEKTFEYQKLLEETIKQYENELEKLDEEYNYNDEDNCIDDIEKLPREYFEKRGEIVDKIVSDNILQSQFDSSLKYSKIKIDSNGAEVIVYTLERMEIHKQILNELEEKYKNVLSEGKVVFSIGISGAGKTSVLKNEIDLEDYVIINSDDIKEIMAEKGLIPKINGLTPIECSSFVHEETSYLANKFFNKMISQNKNIIYDSTGSNLKKLESKMKQLNYYGYNNKNTQVIFVDVTIDTAKRRTMDRYINGIKENMLDNTKVGGRYIKNSVLEHNRSNNNFNTKNAENFYVISTVNNVFDNCKFLHYDNNIDGRNPIKIIKTE